MRTSRLTILLESEFKKAVEARAAALDVSVEEFVRRALEAYDPEADPEELRLVADELEATAARIESKIEALETAYARIDRLRAMRAAGRAKSAPRPARRGRSRRVTGVYDDVKRTLRGLVPFEERLDRALAQATEHDAEDQEKRLIWIETMIERAEAAAARAGESGADGAAAVRLRRETSRRSSARPRRCAANGRRQPKDPSAAP